MEVGSLDLKFFDKIFFFDTNSSDDTFEIVSEYKDIIYQPQKIITPFSDQLKFDKLYSYSNLFELGDWLAIIDSDEFYTENPLPFIEQAESEKATCIETMSAQFYMTDIDNHYQDNISVHKQRLHYLVNWGEIRLFKYLPNHQFNDAEIKQRSATVIPCSRKLLMKHFQFRSPEQVQLRINTRLENKKISNNWGHIASSSWQDYVVPHSLLHKFSGEIKFGLPDGLNLYKVKDNPAYTVASLKWMQKNGHLQDCYQSFLYDKGTKRLLKKIWAKFI